jgi:uncharacterized protein (DUF849 family)
MADVRILTCSVTGGSTTRAQNPNLPCSPEEIANACLEAREAGAAMVHIHVRDPMTGAPSIELDYYRDVVKRIRAAKSDVVINLTTGPGAFYCPTDEDPAIPGPDNMILNAMGRVEHVLELKPEVCSYDIGTMNFASNLIVNVPKVIREMAELIRKAGVKPEVECFDTGDITLAKDLIAAGLIDAPPMFQFVLGGKYGGEATPELVHYMRDRLPPGAIWGGFGIGRMAYPMMASIYVAGGHLRIGLEDTVHLARGVLAESNAALIMKAKRIINDLGGELATPAQAREILKLPAR